MAPPRGSFKIQRHSRVSTNKVHGVPAPGVPGYLLGWQTVCRCYWVSEVAADKQTAERLHQDHRAAWAQQQQAPS